MNNNNGGIEEMQQFINMIMNAVEGENQISVCQENNSSVSVYSFIPYEYNFDEKIYIEGEGCILNIREIDGIEIFYDEIENEYQIHLKNENIYITKL